MTIIRKRHPGAYKPYFWDGVRYKFAARAWSIFRKGKKK